MLGVDRYQLLNKIIFPAALPHILTGNRLSMGVAWVLVVVAEMVAVKSGLGYLSDLGIVIFRNRILRWHQLITYQG